jgi:hypothetical protein
LSSKKIQNSKGKIQRKNSDKKNPIKIKFSRNQTKPKGKELEQRRMNQQRKKESKEKQNNLKNKIQVQKIYKTLIE